jgi:hypothetical protein
MGQLLTDALVIKNETNTGANTATRVGGWMQSAANAIETLPSSLNFFDFNSGSVTAGTQDVWTSLAANVTQGFQRNGISVNSGGLVTYVGENKQFQFSFIISIIGSTNRKIHSAMFKNGQLWPCSEFVQVLTSGNETTIPSQCTVPMSNGDTLQVYLKCSNNDLSVTLDNINVIIKEF